MLELLCFFFQAEDGIRDAQESRGLGDVYKRQQYNNVYVKLSVFYLEKSGLLMGVFVDLTKQKDQEQMMEEIRGKTLEKAQQVITNQMLVAQEIASLLGETTAETKSLLSKLMKILRGENVEE